jgi:hypothetical protein
MRDLFVLSITGAESYVCETGKSMKAVVLAATQKGCWRNIAITLIDRVLSAMACFRQLPCMARIGSRTRILARRV